jgi:hypothetical protein
MKISFRKTTMNKLETTIASLTKRGEHLAAKRAMARDASDAAIKARQHALLSGDLDDQRALDNLQTDVNAAASALAGIEDALAVLGQQKAETERQIAAERDRIERVAAAKKLDEQVTAIEAVLPKYLEQSRALADALLQVGHFHFEANQMASFVQNCTGQIEIAANFTLAELKSMPASIRDSRAAIPPAKPEPEEAAPIEPAPPPTQTVFMMRSAKYRDHDGRKRFAGQWDDVEMPVPSAQRALRHGVAVSTADPRRAQLRGARGSDYKPNATDVIDLDAVEEPKSAPYSFVEIDRSAEARTIQISVPRV